MGLLNPALEQDKHRFFGVNLTELQNVYSVKWCGKC